MVLTRAKNQASLAEYLKACASLDSPPRETESLDQDKLREEMIMMSLRLSDGLFCDELKAKFGYDILKSKAAVIDGLVNSGHLSIEDGRLRLTPESLFISDEIIVKLI